ncbi:hypothetical protein [Acetobacterium sp.]|uniref:hypothetical protein n=1 Tax=Acetobacterium sp. TaxID=1872094 RepID=UPI003593B718
MSKFLGPIHFWVYNKIQIQQEMVADFLALNGETASQRRDELDQRYGISETRPLASVIDEGNIHGWLQINVTRSEYKLADSVTALLKQDPDNYQLIAAIFSATGRSLSQANLTAAAAYKLISDSLLDGMPCDHANALIAESDEQVIWQRNRCVHSNYWSEVGGDIAVYYALREALIRGVLENTGLVYEKTDAVTSVIRRVS